MAQILDYSAGYPGAHAVRLAGYAGVIRYLRKEGSSGVRPITKVEYDDMIANGRDVAFVYQHVSKGQIRQGMAAGRHDATWALAQARMLGIEPRAIYFAADYDAPAVDFAGISAYMDGAAEVLGRSRVGCYGKWALLNHLFSNNRITWGWQTYAWSPGHNKDPKTYHPRANLFQRLAQVTVNGIACDVNDVLKTDYGQQGVDDVSAAEVWGTKMTWTPPGATKPVTVRMDQLALWDNYYSGVAATTITKLVEIIANNESNDVTVEKFQQMFDKMSTDIAESIANATIDVDVTVGGKAVDPTEGTTP